MARCETCGNDYANTFEIRQDGESHTFDSFECAIQKMAPICDSCGCRVIGHGVDAAGKTYCGAHCAKQAGVDGAVDAVG